nr:uncharacterized protein LOC126053967 [Helicoverpa armigera]
MSNRRKPGSRRYKDYEDNLLNVAVELVKNKNLTSYQAEKQFGIPRRTIVNKVKMLHMKKIGCPIRLSEEEESKIANALILCGEYGCPLTRLELRMIVHRYLVKNNKSWIFEHKLPGERWVREFLSRHKERLTLRSTQNIKSSRAAKTYSEYEEYFENLKKSLANIEPNNIVNYDETNLSDDPGSQKCIFKRGTKYPNKILNNSKTAISIMFAATASGEVFPPYVVYQSIHLWTNWCEGGPPGARFNKTKSGWFDADCFGDWFDNIILPWAQQNQEPKVLIGDNLSSHLNIDIITKCQENNIRFVFLPPNSTHDTQPLDVSFFRRLKRAWKNILLDWKVRHPSANSLNKQIFPELLRSLIDTIKISSQQTIRNGFRATGIYPLRPEAVLRKLPDYKENREPQTTFNETLIDFLKECRSPSTSNTTKQRNKKICTKPGESVSTDDFRLSSNNLRVSRGNNKPSKTHENVNINSAIRPGTSTSVIDNLHISQDRFLFYTTPADKNNIVSRNQVKILSNEVIKPSDTQNDQDNSSSSISSPYSLHDDSDDGPFVPSNSDTASFHGSDLEEITSLDNLMEENDNPAIGDYALVKFLSGKNAKYYVGKIIDYKDNEFIAKYLRKNSKGFFSWPLVDDVSTITRLDIEKKLPKPLVGRRGELKFNIDCKIPMSNIY